MDDSKRVGRITGLKNIVIPTGRQSMPRSQWRFKRWQWEASLNGLDFCHEKKRNN